MDTRPNVADTFVHSDRLTQIFRALHEARDVATIDRLNAEMQDIYKILQAGARTRDSIFLSSLCNGESNRVLAMNRVIETLKSSVLGHEFVDVVVINGQIMTVEEGRTHPDRHSERNAVFHPQTGRPGMRIHKGVRHPRTGELSLMN